MVQAAEPAAFAGAAFVVVPDEVVEPVDAGAGVLEPESPEPEEPAPDEPEPDEPEPDESDPDSEELPPDHDDETLEPEDRESVR